MSESNNRRVDYVVDRVERQLICWVEVVDHRQQPYKVRTHKLSARRANWFAFWVQRSKRPVTAYASGWAFLYPTGEIK